MIGSGLKKLANENGMKVAQGVAYGSLQGFAATMCEGSGWKSIIFSTVITDPEKKDLFMQNVNSVDIQRVYRVQSLNIAPRNIQVVFLDNPGTMKKIQEFLVWFIPLLRQAEATTANVCPECGGEVISGRWVMIDGVAHHMHDSCAQLVSSQISEENDRRVEEAKGSYFTGFIGALLGAVIGAIVWAIVLNMGYVASVVGLLIGFLALKGYDLLKGKQGKGKVAILIVVIILGVLLGTFTAEMFTVITMINDGELNLEIAEAPLLVLAVLIEDPEYAGAVGGNALMGLLFAALGVFSLLKKAGKAVAGTKVKNLE